MTIEFVRRSVMLVVATFVLVAAKASAQGPAGNEFGFGIILGEPTGLTAKYWVSKENALTFAIGGRSYFGAPRLQVDYLWHLNVFKTQIVKLYVGPGLGFGFGEGYGGWYYKKGPYWYYRAPGDVGLAVRVMVGLNIIPRNTPIEIFAELGPNIGLAPSFGTAIDGAIGIRFYP